MGKFFALRSYRCSVKELSYNLFSFFHLQGPKGYPGPAGLPGEQVSGGGCRPFVRSSQRHFTVSIIVRPQAMFS